MSDKHALYKHRLYCRWMGMKDRCNNPNNISYHNYGGRGIRVCSEWNDFWVFVAWAELNGWAEGLVLDREQVNGHYEPTNCRWITVKENNNNTRFNVRYLYGGELLTLPQISEKSNINLPCLVARIYVLKWPIEKALVAPSDFKGEKHHSARLSEKEVIEIRALATSGISCREISKNYPVSQASIKRIVDRVTWKHL
jgi:hypothetical protein